MQLSHSKLLVLAGLVWFVIGAMLLQTGIRFLVASCPESEGSIIPYLALGLFVGHFKGRFVLRKVAQRTFDRLLTFPNPTSLGNLYTKGNYFTIIGMVCLGISFKYLGLPLLVRGTIDCIIGAALIQGALGYFQLATKTVKVKT